MYDDPVAVAYAEANGAPRPTASSSQLQTSRTKAVVDEQPDGLRCDGVRVSTEGSVPIEP